MEYRYFDIHSHLYMSQYDADREQLIEHMVSEGIGTIAVGVDLATSKLAVELAGRYEGFFAAVGLHPHDAMEELFDYSQYKALAQHPKVVAIGECGLDYSRLPTDAMLRDKEILKQKEVFLEHIRLAKEVNKPMMLHLRNARDDKGDTAYIDALNVLSSEPSVRVNSHFFAGTLDTAKKFWLRGHTVSFSGVITFAREYHELIAQAPIDKIHAETDAPFASPIPFRGQRNLPRYVVEVVNKIAEIKGEPRERIADQLVHNAKSFFGLR
jgi:TatD DNase family protein